MTAKNPVRRSVPAAELAKQFGVSKRTVERIIAEPREEYLARAAVLRANVIRLREVDKLPYKEIAERLAVPAGTARRIIALERKQRRASTPEQLAG